MADPKYAGLPGIVCDQPDVYETSDLPESEQDEFGETEGGGEATSPAFEVLHISATEARDRFKGETLQAGDVDFSDRISRRHRTGYPSNRPIEWSVYPGGDSDETVVERYQRLQCEVTHLQQDIHELQGSVPHGPAGGGVSAVALSSSVDELQTTLRGLALEEALGSEVVSALAHPDVVLHKKLMTLLEGFKKTGLVAEKEPGSPTHKGGKAIVYELYYAPEHAKLHQMARASQLEKKLGQLENLVGNSPDKMSVLSTWTNHRSLLAAVQVLSARLALLEPGHLDHVEGRLHSVHTRMNAIGERRASAEDAQKQSKVSDLYEAARKCEALCTTLPEVVDRLTGVEELHHEATQFGRSLKQLDAAQMQLSSALHTNATLLTAVQDKFARNLSTIQANVDALDRRIQALPGPPKPATPSGRVA